MGRAMAKQKFLPGEIPDHVMDGLLHMLQRISFGEAVLVAQDRVLVQVEWNEKIRMDCWEEQQEKVDWEEKTLVCLTEHIRQEFSRLQFGRLVIVVKRGRVIGLERTEKQRFTGLDGEGI